MTTKGQEHDDSLPLHHREPLRESTRNERRSLIIVTFIGLLMTQAGLLPTKIDAFGLEFPTLDPFWMLFSCALLLLYFLFAFGIYALADYWADEAQSYGSWSVQDKRVGGVVREVIEAAMHRHPAMQNLPKEVFNKKLDRHVRMANRSIRFAPVHYIFDLYLPPGLGAIVLILVLIKAFHQ